METIKYAINLSPHMSIIFDSTVLKLSRPDTLRFADCMIIIMYATSVGHNIDPALYAAGLLFTWPMMGGGTDLSFFFFTSISVHSPGLVCSYQPCDHHWETGGKATFRFWGQLFTSIVKM